MKKIPPVQDAIIKELVERILNSFYKEDNSFHLICALCRIYTSILIAEDFTLKEFDTFQEKQRLDFIHHLKSESLQN